jgi:hypothetical protein
MHILMAIMGILMEITVILTVDILTVITGTVTNRT